MASRNLEIAGTEREVNKAVQTAGEHYVDQRDKRMKLTKKEKEGKQALIAVMKDQGVNSYVDLEAKPPVIITLSSTDDVKVTKYKADDEDEDGEEKGGEE